MNDLIGTEARKQALKTLNQLTVSNILTKPEFDAKITTLERKCKELPEEGLVVTYEVLMNALNLDSHKSLASE